MISYEDRIERLGLTCEFNGRKFFRGHEYVDLGLPSGTLWAKCNLGAKKESDFGNYYQFGQCKPYEKTFKEYHSLELDSVNKVWGNDWKTPTSEQFRELIDNATNEWCKIDGVCGYKFISKNDKTKYIFFPAAGYTSNGSVRTVDSYGLYWSSSLDSDNVNLAYYLYFDDGYVYWDGYNHRFFGFPVRGVVG